MTADAVLNAGSWDDLSVGQSVGPLVHLIDRELVDAFDAVIAPGREAARASMPATLLATDYVLLLHGTLRLGYGLMTRHETQSLQPVPIGTQAVVTGVVTDKFIRRDRHYWTLRYEVRDDTGALCVVHTVTCTVD